MTESFSPSSACVHVFIILSWFKFHNSSKDMSSKNPSSTPSDSDKLFVFVYGTLKRDEPNYHWMTNEDQGRATFHGVGVTVKTYPLVIASKYNIPFLLDQEGVGKRIRGEVFEIDEVKLGHLDILEEYPKLYTRRHELIEMTCDDEDTSTPSRTVSAIAYFLTNFQKDLLELPFLDVYDSRGPHNLPYMSKYLRDESYDHRPQVKIM